MPGHVREKLEQGIDLYGLFWKNSFVQIVFTDTDRCLEYHRRKYAGDDEFFHIVPISIGPRKKKPVMKKYTIIYIRWREGHVDDYPVIAIKRIETDNLEKALEKYDDRPMVLEGWPKERSRGDG